MRVQPRMRKIYFFINTIYFEVFAKYSSIKIKFFTSLPLYYKNDKIQSIQDYKMIFHISLITLTIDFSSYLLPTVQRDSRSYSRRSDWYKKATILLTTITLQKGQVIFYMEANNKNSFLIIYICIHSFFFRTHDHKLFIIKC